MAVQDVRHSRRVGKIGAGRGLRMLVNRRFHITVTTPNPEASRRSYVDVLGTGLALLTSPEPRYKPAEHFFDTGAFRRFYRWQFWQFYG